MLLNTKMFPLGYFIRGSAATSLAIYKVIMIDSKAHKYLIADHRLNKNEFSGFISSTTMEKMIKLGYRYVPPIPTIPTIPVVDEEYESLLI